MAVANPLEFQNVAIYSFKKKRKKKSPLQFVNPKVHLQKHQ